MSRPKNPGKFLLIFAALWILLSVPFILVGIGINRSERLFAQRGITAEGKLTNKTLEERRERDRETKRMTVSISFYAHYQFANAAGQFFDSKDSVDESRWNTLVVGAPVQIQYLPDQPDSSRLARPSSLLGGSLMIGFGALGLTIGFASLGLLLKRRRDL